MADEKIDSELFYLYDRFPGVGNDRDAGPLAKVTEHPSHNVTTEKFPIGTKIVARNHSAVAGVDGLFTLIYLNLEAQDGTNVLAVKHRVALDATTPHPFFVTNEVATDIDESSGPLAVALSAMTTGNYGWFWCGGVCPEEFVSGLGGFYNTDNTVTIGEMVRADLATAGTTVGEMGFAIKASDEQTVIGYAMAADQSL